MKIRSKSKKQREKESVRYVIEKIKKCGSCKHLFNGQCLHHKTPAHAGDWHCINYVPLVNKQLTP